ncbi:MAG: response regulator transcription factor [Pseudobdellovibrionaceae bacterium]
MKRPTVLIVDDESYIREFLAQILSEHFRIAFAKDGKEALEMAKTVKPAIIVLDVLMPGQNGIETCKKLREQRESEQIPIIMLTAVNEPEQRIKAFNAGADDYLAKPFLPEELIARINRKLEKAPVRQPPSKETEFRLGNLKLQFDDLSLEVDGVKCELGQVEYKILNFLLKKRGELVSRQELNDYIWGHELPSDRALDPHITALRKKLQKSHGELKTVYGKGYSIILKDMEN